MPGEQWGMKTCQAAEVHGGAGRRALSCTQATKHNNVHTYTYIDIYAIKTLLHATAGSATDTGGKGGGDIRLMSDQTRSHFIRSKIARAPPPHPSPASIFPFTTAYASSACSCGMRQCSNRGRVAFRPISIK